MAKRITVRAPCRIDLAGGWTDVPNFCSKKSGEVVNIAINKYTKCVMEVDDEFVLVSYGVGKFGRCLGDIRIPDAVPDSFKSVNSQLIMEGHGTEYYGGKR